MTDTSAMPSLAVLIRSSLLPQTGVARLSHCRRFTVIYAAGSPADRIFFVESGLVKLCKRGDDGKEIVLHIVGPGELFGEQSVLSNTTQDLSAEVMETGTIYSIPRDLFLNFCQLQRDMWFQFSQFTLQQARKLERRVELLCLKDVEQRILLTMADLAQSIGSSPNPGEYAIPLSQSELASYIGATRETTSTTLNMLERRGLIQLGRRLLIVPSLSAVIAATEPETHHRATAAATHA